MNTEYQKPTGAFIGASWSALLAGVCAYLIGLWNATMELNEKGYYFIILLYGLFSVVSLQKTVRDKIEGIPVTGIYYGLCWISVIAAMVLLTVGLWNASLALSEKGFYSMSFILSLFAAITVQKNIRDMGKISDSGKVLNDDIIHGNSKKESSYKDEVESGKD